MFKNVVGFPLLLILSLSWLAPPARAAVKPHGLFGHGMVLQQGAKVPVWGTAEAGEKVTVRFQGQEASTTAEGGRWMIHMNNLKSGGPFEMAIEGTNKITLKNVLVGEVWICSGQSNMQWPVNASETPDKLRAEANHPHIRLFTVERREAKTAESQVRTERPDPGAPGAWQECNSQTVGPFSAVAYFFGRDLHKALNVPVGLISTNYGGTAAESWTSRASLEADPELKNIFQNDARNAAARRQAAERYIAALKKSIEAAEKAKEKDESPPAAPQAPRFHPNMSSGLYNAMIAPLIPYAIKGAIWYQGESNAGRAHEYRTLFPTMIKDWRANWGQGEFPFLFVQLAPFRKIKTEPGESEWAELREAQRLTSLTLPNAGMAVITDVGDENNIHPNPKGPVGARLALAARAIAYGEKIPHSGPVYAGMNVAENKAVLRFKHVGSGLVAKGGSLSGFTVAGDDHKFFEANAVIEGDTVVVSSPNVSKPVAVRFGWADYPVVNLWNQDGLPASPFRTDDFPWITDPKSKAVAR